MPTREELLLFQHALTPHGGVVDWPDITNKPAVFPPDSHNHDASYEPKDSALQAHVAAAHAPANATTLAAALAAVYPVGCIYTTTVSTNPVTVFGFGTWAAFGAGRVLVGLDAGQTEFDTAEETGGAKTHTLTLGEMPSHTHTQDSHNHTQDAHTHTQNSHNHTQDAHTHTQNAHNHTMRHFPTATGASVGNTIDTSMSGTQTNSGLTTADSTAVNQNATATNQAATATNQNATATNQAATATNQNTGGGGAHNNLQPYIVVYFWKRTA